MTSSVAWTVLLAWGAVGLLFIHLTGRRWHQLHRRWLTAVSKREAGSSLEERSSVIRTYWELVGSVRSGFGYRFLQPDPDPDIERLRLASLAEGRRLRPRFIVFMVCWLGGFLLLTMV
jgi:hypothetical protein